MFALAALRYAARTSKDCTPSPFLGARAARFANTRLGDLVDLCGIVRRRFRIVDALRHRPFLQKINRRGPFDCPILHRSEVGAVDRAAHRFDRLLN